jgi:hypothetical protein
VAAGVLAQIALAGARVWKFQDLVVVRIGDLIARCSDDRSTDRTSAASEAVLRSG